MKDLKAIFMVRDFIGDSCIKERKKYIGGEKPFWLESGSNFYGW